MIIVKKGRSAQLDANKGGKQRLDVYLGAAIRAQLDADAVAAGKLPSEILRESYELWRTLHAHMQELAVALDLSTAHIVRRAVAELWQREVGLAKEEDHTWSSRLAAIESRLAAMERKDHGK